MGFKRSMIYKRLFVIYTSVTICVVGILAIFFIGSASMESKKNNLYINEKLIYDINQEITKTENTTNLILNMLYNNNPVVYDIIDFMKTDKITYSKSKLDKFSQSEDYFYNGIEYFVKSSIELEESIIGISFISYERGEVSTFNRKKQIKVEDIEHDYSEKIPSIHCEENVLTYLREIREPITFKSEGVMAISFDLEYIEKIIDKYDQEISEVILLDSYGNVVYDSANKYIYEKYPYYDKLFKDDDIVRLDDNYFVNTIENKIGLTTVGMMSASEATKLPSIFYQSAIFIALFVFMVAESIIYLKFKHLNNRMDKMIMAMDKVKEGDMNISIPVTGEKDEISFISENFNEMCKQLDDYIKKSYLADINQKQAELSQKKAEIVALQNQINPHFLYNTLESIRMKAICNGDKEVGKMLYTLAFLFRSQVKDKIVISIKQEIDYCKKYLEIFKFRYEDNFEFNVKCDEDVLDKQIIKFTLQPIIENYFIHGIRLEEEGNKIGLYINREDNDIVIKVKDNGRGISEEKLSLLNTRLKHIDYSGQSIGILNAHERIVITYGENYGIKVESKEDEGTTVIVRFPCKEEEK